MTLKHAWLATALLPALAQTAPAATPRRPLQPDTIPVCTSPQPLNLPQPTGAGGGGAMVYNGQDYAAVYNYNGTLYFRRYFADGTPAGAARSVAAANYYVSSAFAYTRPALLWNGSGYAAAWLGTVSGFVVPFFGRLNADGALIGAPVQAGFVGTTPTADAVQLALAWSAVNSLYTLAWSDDRNNATTGRDLFFTQLDAGGAIAGGGARHDLAATVGKTGAQDFPALAWNDSGNWFVLVWQDHRSGTKDEIFSNLISIYGSLGYTGADNLQISAAGSASGPVLVTAGNSEGLAWTDTRSGPAVVYFNRLNSYGGKMLADVPLGQLNSQWPALAWFGSEYGVAWHYNNEPWFQRVTGAGAAAGSPVALSPSYTGLLPALAAGRQGYLAQVTDGWTGYGNSSTLAVGCASDATPPSCPGNLAVTAASPYSVSLNWLPSADAESEPAYYQVLLNNAPAQKTSATQATLTGLIAGTSYSIAVQPVNAAQLQNGACTATVTAVTNPVNACSVVQAGPARPSNPAGRVREKTVLVWNGTNFASAYTDHVSRNVMFQLHAADGSPMGAPVTVASANNFGLVNYDAGYNPSLVWNGGGYGILWWDADRSYKFARLATNGAMIGTPVAASSALQGYVFFAGFGPSLAWNGSGYAAIWMDVRNYATNYSDVYATLFDASGAIAGAGAFHDIVISGLATYQFQPVVAWSSAAGRYQIVWDDYDNAVQYDVLAGSLLNPADGTFTAPAAIVTQAADNMDRISLVDAGGGPGMAWMDYRDGHYEIYFARLNAAGTVTGTPLRITTGTVDKYNPSLAWTGAEFGLFWNANDSGGVPQVWYQRLTASGAQQGAVLPVAGASGLQFHMPDAAWGNGEFVIAVQPYVSGTGGAPHAVALTCANDSTPPTCAGNLLAYNVSGTQATISWSLSGDPESGVGQYVLYRNNTELARTQGGVNVYTDTGLGLSTPYNYMVQPVNNSGVQNFTCTASVYVKTSASLTLTLGKSTPDAMLNWTDAGLNSYTIFRGTSPQVMSLIGATPALSAPDLNVLNDGLSYFYTVDDPGQ